MIPIYSTYSDLTSPQPLGLPILCIHFDYRTLNSFYQNIFIPLPSACCYYLPPLLVAALAFAAALALAEALAFAPAFAMTAALHHRRVRGPARGSASPAWSPERNRAEQADRPTWAAFWAEAAAAGARFRSCRQASAASS